MRADVERIAAWAMGSSIVLLITVWATRGAELNGDVVVWFLCVVIVASAAILLGSRAIRWRDERAKAVHARQHEIVQRLGQEYTQTHPASLQVRLATEPLPKEWVEQRLEEMGETWRWDRYLI